LMMYAGTLTTPPRRAPESEADPGTE
jgi:hypothetical protein